MSVCRQVVKRWRRTDGRGRDKSRQAGAGQGNREPLRFGQEIVALPLCEERQREDRETLTPRFSISNYNDSTEDRIKYIFQPSKRDWFGISQVRKLW